MECTNECRKWFSKEHCDYCQSHYVVTFCCLITDGGAAND